MENKLREKNTSTSWNKSGQWYNKIVGTEGHYYHQHLVLPQTLKLLDLKSNSKLLDVGCGQGVLARAVTTPIEYLGMDSSTQLIAQAKKLDSAPNHHYLVHDATLPYPAGYSHFTHAALVLSLQNMKAAAEVLKHIANALIVGGTLVIVLNHPCFRIPRQSGWEVDEKNKMQKRWVARYMTPMEIPITMHPGASSSEITWTYHHPLSFYFQSLQSSHFHIETVDELISDKESVGKASRMENRSRNDIPLFLTIKAIKS